MLFDYYRAKSIYSKLTSIIHNPYLDGRLNRPNSSEPIFEHIYHSKNLSRPII